MLLYLKFPLSLDTGVPPDLMTHPAPPIQYIAKNQEPNLIKLLIYVSIHRQYEGWASSNIFYGTIRKQSAKSRMQEILQDKRFMIFNKYMTCKGRGVRGIIHQKKPKRCINPMQYVT